MTRACRGCGLGTDRPSGVCLHCTARKQAKVLAALEAEAKAEALTEYPVGEPAPEPDQA